MEKKNVLLFNDNTKRDILGIRLLERALRRRGCDTAICNPSNAKVKLRAFRPHALIAARGDHDVARMASDLCKVYVVAGEGAQQTKETMLSVFMGRGYWKLDSVAWISRCYLWSETTRRWLLDTNMFEDRQLSVVGNPRLDLYRQTALIESLRDSAHRPRRLGVAFSAKSTSTYYGSPRFPQTYFNMHREMTFPITQPGRHFEDVVWRDHAILRTMMRTLRQYLETGPGEVWLRPSPFESPREYAFLEAAYPGRVKVLPDQTLPEFICGVDAVLTCWSTAGLEALLLGIPVISIAGLIDQEHLFRHISPRASGFETFVDFYHRPTSEADLLALVGRAHERALPASPRSAADLAQLMIDLYSWPGTAPACDLIAEDVVADLAGQTRSAPADWRAKLPLRNNIPVPIAAVLAPLRSLYTMARSGDFRTYYNFSRSHDPAVEALLRRLPAAAP